MRRIAIAAALTGAGVLLHQRMLAGCERMFQQMPDDFAPRRMMRGIEEIRANTARTLELLEERGGASAKAKEEPEATLAVASPTQRR